eukprot:4540096-Amphidinium_carterae.1
MTLNFSCKVQRLGARSPPRPVLDDMFCHHSVAKNCFRIPFYALNVALSMYSGNRRILVQGAVSKGIIATSGLPRGCGHVVDMLHV